MSKETVSKEMIRDHRGTWIFAGLAFTCILNNNWTFWSMLSDPASSRAWLYTNQAGMLPCDLLSSILMLLMLIEPLEGAMMTSLAGAVFMFHGVDYAIAAHTVKSDWVSAAAYIGVAIIQEILAVALFVNHKHPISLILPFRPAASKGNYESINSAAETKV